jgi:putative drug exporter of the RND superfamily
VHADEGNKRFFVSGIVPSTRLIGCAELIMVFVFGGLQLNLNPSVEHFGVSLAVAVIVDTAVLRRLLGPASMMLPERIYWHRALVLEPGSVA